MMRVISWLLLILVPACFAETITGVLYSETSGVSGSAAMSVELASRSRVYDLHGTVRMMNGFRFDVCRDIGAIWTVDYQRDRDGSFTMTRIQCDGRVDELVHGAWVIARDHIRQRVSGQPIVQADPISDRFRNSPTFSDYLARLQESDFEFSPSHWRPTCIVVEEVQPTSVRLVSTADCFFEGWIFTVTVARRTPSSPLQIDDVKLRLE